MAAENTNDMDQHSFQDNMRFLAQLIAGMEQVPSFAVPLFYRFVHKEVLLRPIGIQKEKK